MQQDLRSEKPAGDGPERFLKFSVAAAVAPPTTFTLIFLLGALFSGADVLPSIPSNPSVGNILFVLVLVFVGGPIVFGIVGSALLLGVSFALFTVCTPGHRLGVWSSILAGGTAGLLHDALATLSIYAELPQGWGPVLGTWVIRNMVEAGNLYLLLAPPAGGAFAGWLYTKVKLS